MINLSLSSVLPPSPPLLPPLDLGPPPIFFRPCSKKKVLGPPPKNSLDTGLDHLSIQTVCEKVVWPPLPSKIVLEVLFLAYPPFENMFGKCCWSPLPSKNVLEMVLSTRSLKSFLETVFENASPQKHVSNGCWQPLPPQTVLETFFGRISIRKRFWKRFLSTPPFKKNFGNGFWPHLAFQGFQKPAGCEEALLVNCSNQTKVVERNRETGVLPVQF